MLEVKILLQYLYYTLQFSKHIKQILITGNSQEVVHKWWSGLQSITNYNKTELFFDLMQFKHQEMINGYIKGKYQYKNLKKEPVNWENVFH